MKLHKEYDGSDPHLIGAYLAACTVYAGIYGRSPVGNSYDYFGKINRETAAFLQQVAADAVKKFYCCQPESGRQGLIYESRAPLVEPGPCGL